jgi:type VI secretion system VgrG family protein
MSTSLSEQRVFRIHSPSLDEGVVEKLSVVGEESLNALFAFQLEVVWGGSHALDTEALLSETLELQLLNHGEETRSFYGMVSEIHESLYTDAHLAGSNACALRITMVPRAWLLTLHKESEIFQHVTPQEVLTQKLARYQLNDGTDVVFDLQNPYPSREFVVQYNETDWDFINRLCEYWGWAYYFRHDEGHDVLCITDHGNSYPNLPDSDSLVTLDSKGTGNHVVELSTRHRRVSEKVIVHDYNFRNPLVKLDAEQVTQRPQSQGTSVSYGEHFKSPEEGTYLARVRSEAVAVDHHVVRGSGHRMAMSAGHVFQLDSSRHDQEEMLCTSVQYLYQPGQGGTSALSNTFTAIPRSVPYRPKQRVPKPKVSGLVHARVDGEIMGDYAEIDGSGLYRVTFNYDRSGRNKLGASRPVRMLQPHAGTDYGMHFPLRPGTEVMIGFVEGDPDRPVIVGAIPNPLTRSPVEGGNYTQNVLRSGSRNEMVMEDHHGRERVRVHSPLHNTTMQLGSYEEPEEGALIRTQANISQIAGQTMNATSPKSNILTDYSTTLVGQNSVWWTGVKGLSEAFSRDADSFQTVNGESSNVAENLNYLLDDPEQDEEKKPEVAAYSSSSTWSGLTNSLSDKAQQDAMSSSYDVGERSDTTSRESYARTYGEDVMQMPQPSSIVGSSGSTSLLAKQKVFVYANDSTTVASDHTTRLVGKQQVEVHSPEEVEITGRRTIRMTSHGLADIHSNQYSLRSGGDPEERDEALPPEISIGILGEQSLRMKSAEASIVSCAHQDVIMHAHEGDIAGVAQKNVKIQAEKGTVHVEAGDDITLKTPQKIILDSKSIIGLKGPAGIRMTSDGTLEIEASAIEMTGTVTINGDLLVYGNALISGDEDVVGSLNVSGASNL